MNDLELWQVFIGGVAVPVLAYWLKDGIFNLLKARRARREQLAKDEADAQEQEDVDMRRRCTVYEARVRVLDDYAHQLREDYARDTGKAPRAWPPLIVGD